MKQYALLHGVCGLAEGYSDTTVRWFSDLDKAMEAKQQSLALLSITEHEEIESSTDGMQDIITFSHDESEAEILKIIPVEYMWSDNPLIQPHICREYLVWNQMDCRAEWGGKYLLSDLGVIKDLCERLDAIAVAVGVEPLHEFVKDLRRYGNAMFDADDICIYYFEIPKSTKQ